MWEEFKVVCMFIPGKKVCSECIAERQDHEALTCRMAISLEFSF